ncbi:MAG: PP2C family protein-serine/threonine phosphatase [Spirulinaceae cyanobacterium RM2_2_10]|nr:PP2C family protein-serine/threonine phosphatase [Spirulinaceae cyanobacterium SM2_1_0]NJO19575.1 PP2C family protein-serine/threonine phosphatase [Spirulinaceae cyanobacterium RM2_2_10]
MTATPLPPPSPSDSLGDREAAPIVALKELVARLYREQNRIQNLLSSLGFALRSFNNLNQFLEIVPLMAARVTDADGGALVLLKANGQATLEQLHCQEGHACQDIRQILEQATANLILPSTEKNVASRTLSLTTAAAASLDEQLRQDLGPDVRLFGTPILVKSRERGRLYIFSRERDYVWTPTRKKLVQLVADQTAVAIANHELANELRQKERLDRELEIASEIQVHLFPHKCPTIAGVELAAACQTAHRVGGDYYDFIPTTYDQFRADAQEPVATVPWSIVIGDVMGKGVPAGLLMTMTRGMLRAEVLNRHAPAKIVQHLNQVMYADLDNSHRFLTLFYSEYDPQTRRLSYTNAAHHPPLLWQAATGRTLRLDTPGMLIGLDLNSQYDDAETQLEPGDTIVYYTDGFTDAVSPDGDRFDEGRLVRAFQDACEQGSPPQAILERLFASVGQFIGPGGHNDDDMTLVVLQVKPED